MIRRSIENSVVSVKRNILLTEYVCFKFIDVVDQSAYSSAFKSVFVTIESYRREVDANSTHENGFCIYLLKKKISTKLLMTMK